MAVNYKTAIVTAGLEWYVDAGNVKSNTGAGSTWYDLSRYGRHQGLYGGATFTTVNGVKCVDCTVEGRYTVDNGTTYTLTNGHTLIAWARPLADSQVSTWRTLWRTQVDDHPLLIQDASNAIGYYDNNGAGFQSYGINLGTIGKENTWTMFSLVGSGSTTTLYIDNLAYSGTVNYNAGGLTHDAFGAAAGSQSFGYVAIGMIYSRALTTAEISRNFMAFRSRFGL